MRTALTKTLLRSLHAVWPRQGLKPFFETNVATFALEPAGVEQSSLIGTSVVHSAEEMRVDGSLRVGKVGIVASDRSRSQR